MRAAALVQTPALRVSNAPLPLSTPAIRRSGALSRAFSAVVLAVGLFGAAASAHSQTMLFPATATAPADSDSNAVELGVKFKSDSAGFITGIRFYKASTNTGTHVAHLWTTGGTLLATATFTGETASGWQQVNFSKSVAITANTVYIASYFAPNGHYSSTNSYFSSKGVDVIPLHALANSTSANGVYLYSSTGGFPKSSYQASNYWVTPVFQVSSSAGVGTPQLSVGASSLSFGNVALNASAVLSVVLKSSGTSAVTVNSASISGTGFSLVAGTFPATLSPGQSLTLQAAFTPTTAKSYTGALTVSSNSASGGTASIALGGTGVSSSAKLTLGASSLAFGSVAVGSSTTKAVTLTSSGTAALTISSAAISGSGFSLVGGSFPITLAAGKSTALTVQYKPTATGNASGALSIASNSTTGTATVGLSGTGTGTAPSVALTWSAPSSSPTTIAGYNIYRMIGGGSGYTVVNASTIASTTYTDNGVTSGTKYSYYVTSVDQNKVESTASNSVSVSVP